ncbi:uncharacterized protein M6B38_103085 [Iris pallida]|uniref:Uncharacterized protein n=1 Tax=Iris pallida TaxID=29817 RepID=A0AAX6G7C8_IRIPA|nr:uncharacterized protein M6B38_103085 [Iris pallida]
MERKWQKNRRLVEAALEVLNEPDPLLKAQLGEAAAARWIEEEEEEEEEEEVEGEIDINHHLPLVPDRPARLSTVKLVPSHLMPKVGTQRAGRPSSTALSTLRAGPSISPGTSSPTLDCRSPCPLTSSATSCRLLGTKAVTSPFSLPGFESSAPSTGPSLPTTAYGTPPLPPPNICSLVLSSCTAFMRPNDSTYFQPSFLVSKMEVMKAQQIC